MDTVTKESLGQYTARDGKPLLFRKWYGIRDVVISLHGIESNSGWFSPFLSRLSEKGFTIYGMDRRGSGLNKEGRGDISDYNIFLDDIEDALKFVKGQNVGKKVFLIGICWGGLLAVNYVAKDKTPPDGLILLSPAIYRKIDLNPFIKFAAKLCFLFSPTFHFKIPIRDEMFTKNQKYLDFIKKDTMRLCTLTCRFFNEILKMENELSPTNHRLNIPTCILLAGHDEIVDNKKVEEWFGRLKSNDKTIKIFDNFCHVMPFEEKIEPLIDFIANWIKTKESVFESHSLRN